MKIEGELWAGRGNFNLVQNTVLDKEPDENSWRHIDFMLFDLPQAAGQNHLGITAIPQVNNKLTISE